MKRLLFITIVFSVVSCKEENCFHGEILDEKETGAKYICFVDINISDLD